MIKDEKEQIKMLKTILVKNMNGIPQSVINGSFQAAVRYKEDHRKVLKLLKKNAPTINELNWAIRAMSGEQGN